MAEAGSLIRVILYVIGFILIVSAFQFFISIHPPRFYDRDIPSNYGLVYENIAIITSDKIKLEAWLISSKEANATIIIGHGYPFNKGNILPVALFLYPDYNLLFYDHRYFGESQGRITTAGFKEAEDVRAAIAFVNEQFPEQPIALYGFSLSAAAMLMSKEKVAAIISDSAYADLERMVKQVYFLFGPLKWPFVAATNVIVKLVFGIYPKEISPAAAIKNSNIPILAIHGGKDSQIPVENAYALKKSNPGIELWIVQGADHGQAYALYKEEYERRVKDFLKENIK